ncbi:E3 ubiquitin-protein ligase TRIM56-like [Ostrea edulis]|uniref:E3 ubiquitin-protein ligase TRIM56-like n=1 Tax=Ostrea edulis TaxID=37623 RepID=UPI0024AF3A7E|nr:E3 ubiquitin-protein ligase TRIM56-like [Ostrea edulis]XP_048755991.2 E3 ubiquitin-protein ligase TRIM56-like [Ostrea edulis]XP_048755997.2 E3 ubiquitin-protein ligase TRIM56-like [Ostrea edulis]
MESSIPVNLEELQKKFLECSVCFEIFNEEDHHPRLLPCLHTYCYKCLQRLQSGREVTCPQCKSKHVLEEMGLDTFPKDNTRRDLLDFVKASSDQKALVCSMCVESSTATHRCKQCEGFICMECVQIHGKVVGMKSHELIALQDLSDISLEQLYNFSHQSYCKEKNHENKVLEMYCSSPSCEKPVCSLCAFTSHSGHKISTIPEIYEAECTKLSEASSKVKDKVSEIDRVMELVQQESDDLPVKAEEQKETIRAIFSNAKEILQRKKQDLGREIDVTESDKLNILETQCSELTKLKDSCVQACDFLKHSLRFNNEAAFLEVWPTIETRMKDLKSRTFETKPRTQAKTFRVSNTQNLQEFQNITNKLGIILNSEAYLPNCKVDVVSSCTTGEEICFLVEIKTVDESLIEGENVQVVILKDAVEQTRVECVVADGTIYSGKWRTENAGEYTWYITSNGMKMEFANNSIIVKDNESGIPKP